MRAPKDHFHYRLGELGCPELPLQAQGGRNGRLTLSSGASFSLCDGVTLMA